MNREEVERIKKIFKNDKSGFILSTLLDLNTLEEEARQKMKYKELEKLENATQALKELIMERIESGRSKK